jgi:hypothetical protein
MPDVFVVRAPDVVHETIDGETVIIDMAHGAYYRLETAAARAWLRLMVGAGAADLCAELGTAFAAPDGKIESAVAAFLGELEEFKLIVKASGAPVPVPLAAAPADLPAGARASFPGLAVHRFTDLQELLFLDPVHEVDESGWPVRAPAR